MSIIPARRRRILALVAVSGALVAPLAAQLRKPATSDPCALLTPAALRRVSLPRGVKGVADSAGLTCTWGNPAARQALVLRTYAALQLDEIERMRIAAAVTSDPVLEPSVAPGAWSTNKPYGRVLIAVRNGKGLQLQYYVSPRSYGADRVDVRATEADRQALLAVAKVALGRL